MSNSDILKFGGEFFQAYSRRTVALRMLAMCGVALSSFAVVRAHPDLMRHIAATMLRSSAG